MKKALILGTVLALLAVLAVPMAAFADTEGSVEGTGSVTQTTVAITIPSAFAFGNFVEGRNPASDWAWSGTASVTVTQGTNPSNSWALTAQSVDDSNGSFANGKMYCDALARYLEEAMYVKLWSSGNGESGYAYAGTGVTLNGSGDDTYQLGAVQNISHNDALAGAGSYYIFVKLSIAYVP